MKAKAILFCMATAMLVAGAAGAAQLQGKDAQARKATIEKIKANHKKSPQPRTMKEAELSQHRTATGATAASVPEFLWNELHARKNAQGQLEVVETDAGTAVEATIQEGAAHE